MTEPDSTAAQAEASAVLPTAQPVPAMPVSAVASIAAQLKHAKPGTYARLRRFDPTKDPQAALFEVELLLHAAQVHPRGAEQHQRWALLLHCLAIVQGAHDPRSGPSEAGAVLAQLRFSEARLQQLVEANFPVLADLMPRLARRFAAVGTAVNWLPLADLILYTDTPQEAMAQTARRRLVRSFLQAQRQTTTDTAQPA